MNWFLIGHPGGDHISDQRPRKAAHERQHDYAQTNPQNINASVVRNPCADALPFGILLIEIEFGVFP